MLITLRLTCSTQQYKNNVVSLFPRLLRGSLTGDDADFLAGTCTVALASVFSHVGRPQSKNKLALAD